MLLKELIDKMIRQDYEISLRKGILSNSVVIQVRKWINNCPYTYCQNFNLDKIDIGDIYIYLIDAINEIRILTKEGKKESKND